VLDVFNMHMRSLALVTNGLLANPTLDETSWNSIAKAVGCGTGVYPVFFEFEHTAYFIYALLAANAAQFSCMKVVPARTLEDAVIQSGLSFKFIVDGKKAVPSQIYARQLNQLQQ